MNSGQILGRTVLIVSKHIGGIIVHGHGSRQILIAPATATEGNDTNSRSWRKYSLGTDLTKLRSVLNQSPDAFESTGP